MQKYDVIIVGAGPAGIAAASVLNKSNINYCIIEKNKFPREKLCGGGLTSKCVNLLDKLGLDYKNIYSVRRKDVELVARNVKAEVKLASGIVMVDRAEFDYNNLKQVIKNNYHEEETITKIDNDVLVTNKDLYKFKYIIFADGVNGFSRKLIKGRKLGFCVEFKSKEKTTKTVFDVGAIKKGYGWIFAKKDHTTIGLGTMKSAKADYQSLLVAFCKKHGFEIQKREIRGYHIPVFSKNIYKQSIQNNYILVGDAASLVDPIGGEGIYYALLSGMKAAESIIETTSGKQDLKKIYLNKTKGLYKSLNKRLRWSNIIYSKFGMLLLKTCFKNPRLVNKAKRLIG